MKMKNLSKLLVLGFMSMTVATGIFGSNVSAKTDKDFDENMINGIEITAKNFPDNAVRKALKLYDSNNDGFFSDYEQEHICVDSPLDFYNYYSSKSIYITSESNSIDLKGLSKIKDARGLVIIGSGKKHFRIKNWNELKKAHFKSIAFAEFQTEKLNISDMKYLEQVSFIDARTKSYIDKVTISNNPNLAKVNIRAGKVSFGKNIKLTEANLSAIKGLDISKLSNLKNLFISSSNLKIIDLSNNKDLRKIDLSGAKIKNIDLSNNKNLRELNLSDIKIKNIDLSNNKKLDNLNLSALGIKSINLNKLKKLSSVNIVNCKQLKKINVSNKNNIYRLIIVNCKINTINIVDWPNLVELQIENLKKAKSINVGKCSALSSITINKCNNVKSINLEKCPNLWSAVLKGCKNANDINISDNKQLGKIEIKYFDALKNITIKNTNLEHLQFTGVRLDNLDIFDISSNTTLKEVIFQYNYMKSIDVSNFTKLTYFECIGCNFQNKEIDLSKNNNLNRIDIWGCGIENIKFPENSKITDIDLHDNKLETLDMSLLSNLEGAILNNNQIKNLDLSKNISLKQLYCDNSVTITGLDSNKEFSILDRDGCFNITR